MRTVATTTFFFTSTYHHPQLKRGGSFTITIRGKITKVKKFFYDKRIGEY